MSTLEQPSSPAFYTLQFVLAVPYNVGNLEIGPNAPVALGAIIGAIWQDIFDTYIPIKGNLKVANVSVKVDNQVSSAEASSLFIRVNNTTDYLVTDAIQTDTTTLTHYLSAGMNIPLSQDDFIRVRWETPNWSQNPMGVTIRVLTMIQT